MIFPTTLSIITNAYRDRAERARAVGAWGAVTGLGVAVGPVSGGLLLSNFAWPSVFVALVPVALAAALLAFLVVPESRDPSTPRLDRYGLATATGTISVLVYTIIEAPDRGWSDRATIFGFVLAVVLGLLFVGIERRQEHPMLDLTLFRERAFSAASGAVTVSFFALFGFIFLITQYFQFIRGYGTLSTGLRILPVATSIAIASIIGARLAGRLGTRTVVSFGLLLFGGAFAWISQSTTTTPYLVIVGQMLLMGTGLGLTSTPATESILSVLSPEKAGVGSAVNDATRELGGTLGVAIIGSVFTSLYASHLLHSAATHLPSPVLHAAQRSVGAGIAIATHAPSPVLEAVRTSFMTGLHAGCLVAAAVCWTGAIGALSLPGRPTRTMNNPGLAPASIAS